VISTDGKTISTSFKNEIDLDKFMHNQLGFKASFYQKEDFTIDKIEFSYAYSTIMRGFSRSMVVANEKWHTVENNARESCLWHSIATCRNYISQELLLHDSEEANYKRVRSAKDLKEAMNLKRKKEGLEPLQGGGDDETIQLICDYVKTPIKLYNNVYEEIKHFEPKEYNYKHGSTSKKHFF
jgi:hypothetical protein